MGKTLNAKFSFHLNVHIKENWKKKLCKVNSFIYCIMISVLCIITFAEYTFVSKVPKTAKKKMSLTEVELFKVFDKQYHKIN